MQKASSDASCVISARLVVLLVVELVVHCSSRLVVLVEASSGASSGLVVELVVFVSMRN